MLVVADAHFVARLCTETYVIRSAARGVVTRGTQLQMLKAQECLATAAIQAAPGVLLCILVRNQTAAVRLISYDRRYCGSIFAATPRNFELAAARRAK